MQFEIEIIKWFQSIGNAVLDVIGEGITIFAEQYVMIVIIAFIYFVYNKKLGEAIAYSIFLSLNINNTIKALVKAPRPYEYDHTIKGKRAQTATGYSFPSGHTQAATVLYSSISLRLKKQKITIAAIIIIFLIGISRLYLGVHFPRDVIAGWVLGIGSTFLGAYLYDKFAKSYKSKMLLLLITAIIFIPFGFVFYQSDFQALEKYLDFYKSISLFLGFIAAMAIENKYVNFDCSGPLKMRLIRFFMGLLIVGIVYLGLKLIFPKEVLICDMIRYFCVIFIPMGIYPLTFKKLHLM
jgi:membrane-associated phospholipid phosphatase